jgi:polyhydroxyalkanoate synthase
MLCINESQLAFLDDMMWEQGLLDTSQMAGAFQMLRSHDLFWFGMIRET